MFGRRTADAEAPRPAPTAPPPAPAGGPVVATRPQPKPLGGDEDGFGADDEFIVVQPRRETSAALRERAKAEPTAPILPQNSGGPKNTAGFEQLKAAQNAVQVVKDQTEYYHQTKTAIYTALINTIDLSQLAQLDTKTAAAEIRDIVAELVAIKSVSMSVSEQEHLVQDIINDVLGYGPLEPLLARDDIADIMVNGAGRVFIEVSGKVQLTNVRFRDNVQLMNICQRIVSQVGRRVDESSPICDARLPDGSRVNVIAPPLALDGPTLTIRKFKRDKLTMKNLVEYASISPEGARVLGVIGAARCNVLISGGT
ncbi:MAG: Flp pilus assembly complex ATPase component TadA, partial [Proteobacteria bacterium]|nr:Flp pilus assembly complex ATPase component TadA [Pseudomonadota bacterium]